MLQKLAIALIRIYRATLSSFFGGACRFYPTCSAYSMQALEEHGVGLGLWLTAKRLGRCHPWCSGGYDPVPVVERAN